MSKIEWTERTWNPVTGCTKVSAGCKHCYAEVMARRLNGMGNPRYANGFEVTLHRDKIREPLSWRKPQIVFVNSMSDLFHKTVPDEFIAGICHTMKDASHHVFQVLTKRHERLQSLLSGKLRWAGELENVWWGVSVEDRKHGLPRIEALRETPAYVRFLSCEPLLEGLGPLNLTGIHWVIVGGESGHHARPMQAQWARNIRRDCFKQSVPFFFKQWGGTPKEKASNGRLLDGKLHDEFPLWATNRGKDA